MFFSVLIYPPRPVKGGIIITEYDLKCLEEKEYLNDNVINFYLKYVFLNNLGNEDQKKSFIFDTFFYENVKK